MLSHAHGSLRSRLRLSTATLALGAAMIIAEPAFAQAASAVDPGQAATPQPDQPGAPPSPQDAAANPAPAGGATPDARTTERRVEQQAQDAAAAAQGNPQDAQPSEVVVTGFRRSLETAVQQKRSVDLIVESVSAEDIGKLPDNSIAESIARLPGLTAQRSFGRDTTISIRGFSPDFSTTLLNGREQTSTGDNRAVEYDQYPAEIINQVVVYKTGQPNIIGQGLSGTVDLRTIRPLEFGKRVISIGARGSYNDNGQLNPDSNKFGFRANAVFVDQFADDKVGVALAGSYSREAYQIKEFNAWGYFAPDNTGNSAISGSKSYNTSSELRRYGVTGTLELKPTDHWTSTFDAFYSNFQDDQTHRGIELPFSYFGSVFTPTNATSSGGLYTSGTFNNVQGVVRNNIFQRHANLYAFGWNNSYKGDDGWQAFFDVSFSKTKRNERDLESYSGTGYNWSGNDPTNHDVTDTIGFRSGGQGSNFTHQLNYSDPNLILLTDPLGWGGSTVQAGYNNNRIISDRIWQYHAEAQKDFESDWVSSVQVGANYTNHDKSLDPQENFLVLASGAKQEQIPSQYIQKSTDLTYLGLGPILTYDPLAMIAGGVYALKPNTSPDVYAKAYGIHEDLFTLYTQTNLKHEFAGFRMTGILGVQAINTNQRSNGYYISPANGAGVPTLTAYGDGATYWDILPSANLSFRFPSGFVIRAAAAREVMRPRMDDMRASLSYGTTNDPNTGLIVPSGTRGDPRLRPYRANAFDLNFERYFGNQGYVAAQFFYKRLVNYVIENVQTTYNYTGLPFTGQQPDSFAGFVTQPVNIDAGKIYGVELAGTLPFGVFSKAFDGFGFTGSGSYTKSKADIPGIGNSSLPGYSKWVASGTAFFEKYGFSARGSLRYRSKFVGEVVGFGDARVLRDAKPEAIVDAQIGYDFAKDSALRGLSIYVQGQNLTDERFATYLPASKQQIIDYQTFGRRFLVGFTYKF